MRFETAERSGCPRLMELMISMIILSVKIRQGMGKCSTREWINFVGGLENFIKGVDNLPRGVGKRFFFEGIPFDALFSFAFLKKIIHEKRCQSHKGGAEILERDGYLIIISWRGLDNFLMGDQKRFQT